VLCCAVPSCSVAALNNDLDECALLTNNKGKPLLTSLAGGKCTEEGRLIIQAVVRHMAGHFWGGGSSGHTSMSVQGKQCLQAYFGLQAYFDLAAHVADQPTLNVVRTKRHMSGLCHAVLCCPMPLVFAATAWLCGTV
jgi:hypothetical protein